jgi:hypothetical protein
MLRALVITGIILSSAVVGYGIQQEYEPVVIEPESYVAPEIVEEPESTVVYIQYTPEPEPTPEVEVAPAPVASPEMPALPGGPVSCKTFGSPWTAQQYMDAYPASQPILDPEGDGHACGQPKPNPATMNTPPPTYEKRVPTPDNPCYPSCEYEALQKLTPDQREAIGAVRHMPPYEKNK